MYRTFNMGIGMVFIVDPSNVNIVKNVLNNLTEVYEIGNVVKGKKEVSV
jgi:phosphoribosylformylglycinamidine cyclo-ligase